MLEKVTPTTASLLNYWFGEGFCNEREINFHEGQRQAILNIIYLHEVMGENCVMDAYQGIIPELMDRADLAQLAKPKYQMPKYAPSYRKLTAHRRNRGTNRQLGQDEVKRWKEILKEAKHA